MRVRANSRVEHPMTPALFLSSAAFSTSFLSPRSRTRSHPSHRAPLLPFRPSLPPQCNISTQHSDDTVRQEIHPDGNEQGNPLLHTELGEILRDTESELKDIKETRTMALAEGHRLLNGVGSAAEEELVGLEKLVHKKTLLNRGGAAEKEMEGGPREKRTQELAEELQRMRGVVEELWASRRTSGKIVRTDEEANTLIEKQGENEKEPDELGNLARQVGPGLRWDRKDVRGLTEDIQRLGRGGERWDGEGEGDGREDMEKLFEREMKEEREALLEIWGEEKSEEVEKMLKSEEVVLGEIMEKGVRGEDEAWGRLTGLTNLERRKAKENGGHTVRLIPEEIRKKKELVEMRRREMMEASGQEEDGTKEQDLGGDFEQLYRNAAAAIEKRPWCPGCEKVKTYDVDGVVELCPTCEANKEVVPVVKPGQVVYERGSYQARQAAREEAEATEATTAAALKVANDFSAEREAARRDLFDRQHTVSNMESNSRRETATHVPRSIPSTHSPGKDKDGHGNGTGSSDGGSGTVGRDRRARQKEWNIAASERSLRTFNPIRNLIQNIEVEPNPEKTLIKLSVGDPTLYGNLRVSTLAIDEFQKAIKNRESNGYSLSMGSETARTAVAKKYSLPSTPLTADDVVLASGTSGALELVIGAIANAGDNVLLPMPGFPLFRTIAEYFGIECRYYSLVPSRDWEINLVDLNRLADDRTAAILVNNPSNPCGSVYSKSHLQDLLAVASNLYLPIIADEVYADMAFSATTYTPLASLSSDVPVLFVGSISKQFVVPGWRLGWILIHDRRKLFTAGGVRKGIQQLTTRMLVPSTPVQAILPKMLSDEGDSSVRELMHQLETQAKFAMHSLESVQGFQCIPPQGSMYLMAKVDVDLLGLKDDMEFTEKLLEEEAVFVLPGKCFMAPNFVRIVFCAPQAVLGEAFHRIRAFCARRTGAM